MDSCKQRISRLEGESGVRDRLEGVRAAEIEAQVERRFKALQREHETFVANTREEFKKVNEYRGALDDLGKTMATRREMEQGLGDLDKQVEALRDRASEAQGGRLRGEHIKASTVALMGIGVTLLVVLSNLLGHYI